MLPEHLTWWQDNPRNASWLAYNARTATAGYKKVWMDPRDLARLPGRNGEHFRMSSGFSRDNVSKLAASMQSRGFKPDYEIFVGVEQDGRAYIFEGNHRTRAAIRAGIHRVPVEIRYYGGSELNVGTWTPRILA